MDISEVLPTDPKALLGVVAAALATVAYAPYLRDILGGKTRPHRATWLIWAVLSALSTASQASQGLSNPLMFSLVQTTATLIVCLLSIRFGLGTCLNRWDLMILVAAGIGLGLWYVTNSAGYALFIAIAISSLGGVATVIKSYRAPGTETLTCWVLNMVGAGLAVAAVQELNWIILAYPLYLFVLYAAIILAILAGRRAQPGPDGGRRPSADYGDASATLPVDVQRMRHIKTPPAQQGVQSFMSETVWSSSRAVSPALPRFPQDARSC